ncbi:MAG: hypothetical protein R6V12_07995, partial [Candidatus Hydrogenedentota bacterium]
TLRQTLDKMGARVDEATQEIRDLETRVEKLQIAEHPEVPAKDAETGEALKAMMQALQESSESEGEAAPKNPLEGMVSMFSGEEGKNMARMSAQFSVPTMYGDLFKELNLPPETEAQVREILIDSMAEQISQNFDAMNNEADPEEMRKNMEAHGQKLRDELATVLTANELAIFDEYETNKERRMLESGIDVQLTMFANGLTEENRTMFRDVIVEEMTAEGHSMTSPENYANPGAAIDRQITAFRTARDRVAPVITEDQLAHVDSFVQQMENMMSAQREFVESFMSRDPEPEE